jgi:hypothetical protein
MQTTLDSIFRVKNDLNSKCFRSQISLEKKFITRRKKLATSTNVAQLVGYRIFFGKFFEVRFVVLNIASTFNR